jgi:hypothetical protein
MPVVLTSEVSFQGLQAALTQAKASLDKVYQISTALEARASKAEQGTQAPSNQSQTPVDLGVTDADLANAPRNPDGSVKLESFEQSIAEMRRIAGFK